MIPSHERLFKDNTAPVVDVPITNEEKANPAPPKPKAEQESPIRASCCRGKLGPGVMDASGAVRFKQAELRSSTSRPKHQAGAESDGPKQAKHRGGSKKLARVKSEATTKASIEARPTTNMIVPPARTRKAAGKPRLAQWGMGNMPPERAQLLATVGKSKWCASYTAS